MMPSFLSPHTRDNNSRRRGSDFDEVSGAIACVYRKNEDPLMDELTHHGMAIGRNDMRTLRLVLDMMDCETVINPKTGNTVLHTIVSQRQKKEFDSLMSIAGFPLNYQNHRGETALSLCFAVKRRRMSPENFAIPEQYPSRGAVDGPSEEYFACELVKRGARMDCTLLSDNETLLNLAIEKSYFQLSKQLMDMGHDVNAENDYGMTPLCACLEMYYPRSDEEEMVAALLCHGANPNLGRLSQGYNVFEWAVIYRPHPLQEIIFLSMEDAHISMDVHVEVLLFLAMKKSPLFLNTVRHSNDVIVNDLSLSYLGYLFMIDVDDLAILIKKCPNAIRGLLSRKTINPPTKISFERRFMENTNLLLESDIRDDVLDFLRNLNKDMLIIGDSTSSENTTLEYACFLLSYGVRLKDSHLTTFYERYGFGELLEILVHMEVKRSIVDDAFLRLLLNVRFNVPDVVEEAKRSHLKNVNCLLPHFADARLRAVCVDEEGLEIETDQPDVPKLAELARNAFRKYFIRSHAIKRPVQFYTLVNQLPIARRHKKMIMFQEKLYYPVTNKLFK